jgi:serine/threonine protein kinase
MLTGRTPFYSQNRDEMFKSILTKPCPMEDYFSPEVADLLGHLLTTNPNERITSYAEIV